MKKILLFLVMVISFQNLLADDFEVDGSSYNIVSIEELTCELSKAKQGISNFVIPDKIEYRGRTLSVVAIGNSAFSNNKDLISIVIPSSIKKIGYNAFKACVNLKSIDIPSTVLELSKGIFEDCTELQYINMFNVYDNLPTLFIKGCSSLKKFVIGNKINQLPYSGSYSTGYDMLYGRFTWRMDDDDLTAKVDTLIIEDSQESLYTPTYWVNPVYNGDLYSSFGMLPIKYAYVGRDLTYRNANPGSDSAGPFNGNKTLESIEIGGFATKTFRLGCSNLSEVTLGENIKSVNGIDFLSTNLQSLRMKSTTPPTITDDFKNSFYLNTIVYVPAGTIELYKNAEKWKNFWNIREWDISSGIKGIPSEAECKHEVIRYNSIGQKIYSQEPGLNIILYNDGTAKKVLIKK